MNFCLTPQQYRRLAEGLLRKALEAPIENKQELISLSPQGNPFRATPVMPAEAHRGR
jgi:hypothetical protein